MGKADKSKKTSSGQLSEKVEEAIEQLPNMEVSRLIYLLKCPCDPDPVSTKAQLLQLLEKDNMAPMYSSLCDEMKWAKDASLLSQMQSANELELASISVQLKDAMDNLGDVEVLDALFSRATLYSRIGDKENAVAAFKEASSKPQSVNQRIKVVLHEIRIGLFFDDLISVGENIEKAKNLINEGGDWDRRNRLKVYEGSYLLLTRDFKKAATLFQESVATFTADELMSYQTMIFYCILSSVLTNSRTQLKEKIVDCSEIRAATLDQPLLTSFINGLYDCQYAKFFQAMTQLDETLLRDRYVARHVRYIYRELRVLAYTQFLEAYKSVTMISMADSFGVGVAFLDGELARFISAGRLNAKIDKVAGVIETNRPDMKNTQYQHVITKGDHLLNRIQKLGRNINI